MLKPIYWTFKIEAIILLLFFGVNAIVPLALNPLVSLVWIILGIGIWIIANGISKGKRWAPATALVGTTLPFILIVSIMNIIQRDFFTIYEGSRDAGAFSIPSHIWFIFAVNIILSIILVYKKDDLIPQEKIKRTGPAINASVVVAIVLFIISFISTSILRHFSTAFLILGAVLAIASFIIILIFFLNLRRAGKTSTKLYIVTREVMIISIIAIALTLPFGIMATRFAITPPEVGIAHALQKQTPISPDQSPRSEWKIYVSEVSQFSIEYPPSWFIDQKSLGLTRERVVIFKSQEKGGITLFSIELSSKESSKFSEVRSNSVEETTFAERFAYLYVPSSQNFPTEFIQPRKIYIPYDDNTYVIQIIRYDLEQVTEALDTFQILPSS